MSNRKKEDVALDESEFSTELDQHSTFTKAIFYVSVGAFGILFFYCFIYAVSVHYDPHTHAPPRATPPCGPVVGKWDTKMSTLAVFRGIRYGQPPVGELRFKHPQPVYPWTNDFNASQNGNICYQYGAYTSAANQSEDCLNLNVWTKTLPPMNETPPPVVVFLHGGGNVYGSVQSYRDLDFLIRNSSICLVAPNYRLNAFGFLALPELTALEGASGNYGIADIVLALHWIQNNIASFGCDPTRVTVLGHGSGATNAFALLSSPTRGHGLFTSIIALSGSPNISMSRDVAEQQNKRTFLANTPCADSNAVVTCLQNLTAQEILKAIPNGTNSPNWLIRSYWPTDPSGLNLPGLVIVDGDIVEVPFIESLINADVDVPVFVQNTRDELELFYANPAINTYNASQYNEYLINNFASFGDGTGTAGTQLAAQYASVTNVSVIRSYYDLQTDIGIYCPWIQLGVRASQIIYLSVVVQPPSKPVSVTPTTSVEDPFQLWDFMLITQSWNFFQAYGGSIFDAGKGSGNVAGYTPSAVDLKLGVTLRNQLYEFINTGQVTGLTPISSTSDPNLYHIALQGSEQNSSSVADVVNYRKEYCDLLKSSSVGLSDSRFWWIN